MIVDFDNLSEVRNCHRKELIVFTGGCFDLVHEGHAEGLEFSRSLGDLLVVGVSSDERVKQRKGESRPIRKEAGRLAVVNAFRAVDYTFIMPLPAEMTPTIQVIQALRPNIFVDNFENKDRWEISRSFIEAMGTQLIYNELPKRDSTTYIIDRANAVNML